MMVKAKRRQPLLINFMLLKFHSFSIIFSIFFIHFTLKWVWYRTYYLEIISRNNFRINGNESVNDPGIWWQNPYFPRVVCFLKVKTIWLVIYKKGRTIISPWKYEWCHYRIMFYDHKSFHAQCNFYSVEEVKSGISALCTLYRYTHPYNGNSVKKIE